MANSAQRPSITQTPVGGPGPPRTGYSSLRSSKRGSFDIKMFWNVKHYLIKHKVVEKACYDVSVKAVQTMNGDIVLAMSGVPSTASKFAFRLSFNCQYEML
ncbi:hypothetical protein WUBG_18590 [Wuchereria bancrofti]|uniref:Uncharacterized protein n=1 Tax=Wuchereria bancrofti TaxID=6293 RepID=J9DLL0_WUCBA|nr:hypothetical protein WUBG_18590 [Wuchereria bancrofti]